MLENLHRLSPFSAGALVEGVLEGELSSSDPSATCPLHSLVGSPRVPSSLITIVINTF